MAFSTTLTADLGAADLIVSVASNSGARITYPWRATIGDEVVYVTGGVEEGLDWSVLRGAEDTDPAGHLTGSTLSAFGSGVQTVRLLGPFNVTFATGVDNGNGARINALAALAADVLLVKAWAVMRAPWNVGSDMVIRLSDTADESGPLQIDILKYNVSFDDSFAPGSDVYREITTGSWTVPAAIVYCYIGGVGPDGGWLTVDAPSGAATGEADIYALIAEPA